MSKTNPGNQSHKDGDFKRKKIMRHDRSILVISTIILVGLFISACTPTQIEAASAALEATTTSAVNNNTEDPAEIVSVEGTEVSEGEASVISNDTGDDPVRPEGWSDETHSKSADPNYEVVFPEDQVNTMTITIDPDNWQAMLDDMTATYGEPGSNSRQGGGLGGPGKTCWPWSGWSHWRRFHNRKSDLGGSDYPI